MPLQMYTRYYSYPVYDFIAYIINYIGSRATTTFKFGFIALDLLSIIKEDAGEYICRVSSNSGSVESHASLSVTGKHHLEIYIFLT